MVSMECSIHEIHTTQDGYIAILTVHYSLSVKLVVGRHSKKLVTIVQFVIKAQNLVYVFKKSL